MIADATDSLKMTFRAFAKEDLRSALDVGCGTGEKTAHIARDIGTTVGIDPDGGDIRDAHSRYGSRHLCFQVARAEALCFVEASFDAVFFNESLHHVPVARQLDALREAHRVLKPRGRILIIEPVCGSGSFGRTLQLYLDEKVQKQSAIKSIQAVGMATFRLHAKAEIQIQYRFRGFEDFWTFFVVTKPEAREDKAMIRDTRERFGRCRRHSEGDTILDYDATVWQLHKR